MVWAQAETGLAFDGQISQQERVQITDGDIRIEADDLIYDVERGTVEATGNVQIFHKDDVYDTESIIYYTKTDTGVMGAFKGTFEGKVKNFLIAGGSVVMTDGVEEMTMYDATLSRCLLEVPHYQIYAKEVDIEGTVLRLRQAYFKIKGVTVFYLPKFYMDLDWKLPKFRLGFSKEDGSRFSYSSTMSEFFNWVLDLRHKNSDDGEVGLGVEYEKGEVYHKAVFDYNYEGFWVIEDDFSYTNDKWILELDAYRDFSAVDEARYGASLTHQYWTSPVGDWRMGIMVRDETKKTNLETYGGLYTGWRLDYQPDPRVTLSYLGISTHEDKNYDIFMDDYHYQAGDNWLVGLQLPMGETFTLGLNATYNSDGYDWLSQLVTIKQQTCCYMAELSYDLVTYNYELSWGISF